MGCIVFVPATSDPSSGGVESTFETVNRNLKSYPYTITYDGKDIDYITYDLGRGFSITKTFGYTGKDLTTVTLSGDIPVGIDTVKTLIYTGKDLTSIVYS